MKKVISILTATRAEYGLLKPIIKKLVDVPMFDVRIVATGAHLSPEFGLTYKEIEADGFIIDNKIEILLSSDSPVGISKSMGLTLVSFADYFNKLKPDMLIVLGDRYESLAVSMAAMNQRIPIAHLYGGESTEGAIDESIRHAITKLSYLHFTSTEEYRAQVVQMGEDPARVFCVGAIGIENISNETLMSQLELEESISFKLDKPYAVITFHPVTLDDNNEEEQMKALLSACRVQKNLKFIFTKANADANGRIINQLIDGYVGNNDNAIAFASLGLVRYLSALKYCSFVMGNSSSGLIEAPSFGIPTINIGARQQGRLQAASVINCQPLFDDIVCAMRLAQSDEFKIKARKVMNPYGGGKTSNKIQKELVSFFNGGSINLKKKFYDYR